MIERLQCTVLADNYVAAPGLLAEHGLSILVEADDRRILFDTGQGFALRHNVRALGLSLTPLDAIVLSHGHYDHTGGLAFAIEEGRPRRLFVHPAAVNAKFARRHPSGARSIGMPRESSAALKYVQQVIWTPSPTEVVPGIMCTGEIPRSFGPRAGEGMFYLDEECHEPDPLVDDQALFITAKQGLVVILGCAHAGVVDTLKHVCSLSGANSVNVLIGGLHLGRATLNELRAVADGVSRLGCRLLAPCHCTGMNALSYLRGALPDCFKDAGVGTVIETAKVLG